MKEPTQEQVYKQLRQLGPLRVYSQDEAVQILQPHTWRVNSYAYNQVERWRKKITQALTSRVKIHAESKVEYGYRLDLDDALEGIPECFRLARPVKTRPIKIGINLSAASGSFELNCLRGGAVLAFRDLMIKRGRRVQIQIVYGNGLCYKNSFDAKLCHVRINVPNSVPAITPYCLSDEAIYSVGQNMVAPLGNHWQGVYRIHEFESAGIHEFDFVLDRIESHSEQEEEQRIMERLIKLGVAKSQ